MKNNNDKQKKKNERPPSTPPNSPSFTHAQLLRRPLSSPSHSPSTALFHRPPAYGGGAAAANDGVPRTELTAETKGGAVVTKGLPPAAPPYGG